MFIRSRFDIYKLKGKPNNGLYIPERITKSDDAKRGFSGSWTTTSFVLLSTEKGQFGLEQAMVLFVSKIMTLSTISSKFIYS